MADTLVEAVTGHLADRDARIDTLVKMVGELERQNAEQVASLHMALAERTNLVQRLDGARPVPLFGFPRRQS